MSWPIQPPWGSGRAPVSTGTESPLPASTVGGAVASVKRPVRSGQDGVGSGDRRVFWLSGQRIRCEPGSSPARLSADHPFRVAVSCPCNSIIQFPDLSRQLHRRLIAKSNPDPHPRTSLGPRGVPVQDPLGGSRSPAPSTKTTPLVAVYSIRSQSISSGVRFLFPFPRQQEKRLEFGDLGHIPIQSHLLRL